MTPVVCRFKCYEKVEHDVAPESAVGEPLATHTVRFAPVPDPLFGPWEPGAQLELRVVEQAARQFRVGKEYFVTLSAVPLGVGGEGI